MRCYEFLGELLLSGVWLLFDGVLDFVFMLGFFVIVGDVIGGDVIVGDVFLFVLLWWLMLEFCLIFFW